MISPSGRSSISSKARIEAHIFIAFLAYCLHVTLGRRLHALAPGLTPRSVLEKFAAIQMIDVHIPTTDCRELVLTRCTEPEPELQLLLDKTQARVTSPAAAKNHPRSRPNSSPLCSADLQGREPRISIACELPNPQIREQDTWFGFQLNHHDRFSIAVSGAQTRRILGVPLLVRREALRGESSGELRAGFQRLLIGRHPSRRSAQAGVEKFRRRESSSRCNGLLRIPTLRTLRPVLMIGTRIEIP